MNDVRYVNVYENNGKTHSGQVGFLTRGRALEAVRIGKREGEHHLILRVRPKPGHSWQDASFYMMYGYIEGWGK